ncbi:hypothetical protein Godav_004001 [Gossypium davidsonii]|uniref:Uncharacterized protein n=1 Tax=Gossypium davidsonii TaxID=34287 RepID=A0A7J8SKE6_GOSDV|nr:hypothetical protein [Gossypium davidsonii]
MVELSQPRRETLARSEDNNNHNDMPSERWQEVPSLKLCREENDTRSACEEGETLSYYHLQPTKKYIENLNGISERGDMELAKEVESEIKNQIDQEHNVPEISGDTNKVKPQEHYNKNPLTKMMIVRINLIKEGLSIQKFTGPKDKKPVKPPWKRSSSSHTKKKHNQVQQRVRFKYSQTSLTVLLNFFISFLRESSENASCKSKRTPVLETPGVSDPKTSNSGKRVQTINGPLQGNLDSGLLSSMGVVCVTSMNNANILVVQEFYVSLKEQMIKRGYYAIITDVEIQGEDVPISLNDICEFYNIPFYEKYFIDSTDLERFQNIDMEDANMFPVAKMWMQFIGARIAPALNEISLVLQEFSRMNGLRALSYPPYMFKLTPTHQGEGANLDPTHHESSKGGSSYQTDVKGKGKAPVGKRRYHPLDDLKED